MNLFVVLLYSFLRPSHIPFISPSFVFSSSPSSPLSLQLFYFPSPSRPTTLPVSIPSSCILSLYYPSFVSPPSKQTSLQTSLLSSYSPPLSLPLSFPPSSKTLFPSLSPLPPSRFSLSNLPSSYSSLSPSHSHPSSVSGSLFSSPLFLLSLQPPLTLFPSLYPSLPRLRPPNTRLQHAPPRPATQPQLRPSQQ